MIACPFLTEKRSFKNIEFLKRHHDAEHRAVFKNHRENNARQQHQPPHPLFFTNRPNLDEVLCCNIFAFIFISPVRHTMRSLPRRLRLRRFFPR